jgi:hypothetical protein
MCRAKSGRPGRKDKDASGGVPLHENGEIALIKGNEQTQRDSSDRLATHSTTLNPVPESEASKRTFASKEIPL